LISPQIAFAGKKYKWIDAYIETLDPETQYNEIVRTVTLFRATELLTNIDYVTNSILVIQEPKGGEAMFCTGKTSTHKQKRFVDTMAMFRTWFLNGTGSEKLNESVGRLNNLHMSIAKNVPGNFDGDDDFIIATCRMGISNHLFQKRLGFPGFDDQMKTAWYNFCAGVIRMVEKESGPVKGFPTSFNGMVEFNDNFNNQNWTPSMHSQHVAHMLVEQFVERWSPIHATDFIFRQIILTFLPESIIKLHKLGQRRPWLEMFIVFYFQVKLLMIFLLPDPREPTFAARWPNRGK